MMRGINVIRTPGATTGDIGYAIQSYAEGGALLGGVRDFCGPRPTASSITTRRTSCTTAAAGR